MTLCHRTKLNSKTNSRIKLTAQSLALDKMHLGLTARMLPSIFSGAIAGGNFGRRGLGSRHFIRSVAGVWPGSAMPVEAVSVEVIREEYTP